MQVGAALKKRLQELKMAKYRKLCEKGMLVPKQLDTCRKGHILQFFNLRKNSIFTQNSLELKWVIIINGSSLRLTIDLRCNPKKYIGLWSHRRQVSTLTKNDEFTATERLWLA